MITVTFEDRAVAFIDVLGFSALVQSVSLGQTAPSLLDQLVTLLDQAIPNLDRQVGAQVPAALIPAHLQVSDSIVLSAPLQTTLTGWEHYSGLEIVVMRAIQITQMFLHAGYLVRGGIAVGKVWHAPLNIIGPAYQEAHKLETQTTAPRIVLSDTARAQWLNGSKNGSTMCVEYDGQVMVNGLHDYYFGTNDLVSIEAKYDQFSTITQNGMATAPTYEAKYKWWWFSTFLAAQRHVAIGH